MGMDRHAPFFLNTTCTLFKKSAIISGMRKTFLYRMYPNKQQLKALESTLEECRWLYNHTLAYRREAWEQEQRSVSRYDAQARIPLLKAERPSLKSVHS